MRRPLDVRNLRLLLLLLALTGFCSAQGFIGSANITCLNGGSVIAGVCVCAERFEGDQCQSEPCLNGGRRSDDGRCYCPYGLTGQTCETPTFCFSAGVLQDGQCKCQPQWTGIFCNQRICYSGSPVSVGGNDQCLCDIGFTGPFCDTQIACLHGNFTELNECQCAAGFLPPNCSVCEAGLVYMRELDSCLPPNFQNDSKENWSSHIPWWCFLIIALCILLLMLLIIGAIVRIKYKKKTSRVGSAEPVVNGDVSDQLPQSPQQVINP